MIEEKTWDRSMEIQIIDEWKESDLKFDKSSKKPVFSIDTPPPYPSGKWHIGAVAGYSLIDMIARSQRMLGKNVLFPWGVDRNGINIELVVEKKFGKPLREWNREEFIDKCRREIEPITKDLEKTARRVGLSCDFSNTYYTDSPEYRAASQAAFIDMWKRGLVVEDFRPNNYCPSCGTTIADAEVYYQEKETNLIGIIWTTETGEKVEISTTRPELISACQVVLVNPSDDRYKKLHGKKIRLPIYGREVEIRPHPYVDPNYGTGIMMICSYGDAGDVQLFREISLQPIPAIDIDGRMGSPAGPYKGLWPKEARAKIIEDLKALNLVVNEKKIMHKVPTCERSKNPIEIINMKEWYVKQMEFLKDLKRLANNMKFHPDKHRQLLLDWIDNITIDWPVSRRRYYHTEIPIWYCSECRETYVPEPGKYYRPWKEQPDAKCQCGSRRFIGEDRVFDTWFDSSISNMYILGYPGKEVGPFPVSLRTQGRDIVRTWLYYTTLKSLLIRDSKPFEHVFIHGMGLDAHGKKMSKSLGNVVDPDMVMDKYGADAFRLWAASETGIGEDYRISEERMEAAYKTLVKLWNVCKFISQWEQPQKKPKLNPTDEWILYELDQLVSGTKSSYENFDLHTPAINIRNFLWETFASHYMEMVKARAYNQTGAFSQNDRDSAVWTLNVCLDSILKMLAPISPFSTYKLYKSLRGGNIHTEIIESVESKKPEFTASDVISLNSAVWKVKRDTGKSLKDEIEDMVVPKSLKTIESDIKSAHRIKNITYG